MTKLERKILRLRAINVGPDTWRNDYVPVVPHEERLAVSSARSGTVHRWDKVAHGADNRHRCHAVFATSTFATQ